MPTYLSLAPAIQAGTGTLEARMDYEAERQQARSQVAAARAAMATAAEGFYAATTDLIREAYHTEVDRTVLERVGVTNELGPERLRLLKQGRDALQERSAEVVRRELDKLPIWTYRADEPPSLVDTSLPQATQETLWLVRSYSSSGTTSSNRLFVLKQIFGMALAASMRDAEALLSEFGYRGTAPNPSTTLNTPSPSEAMAAAFHQYATCFGEMHGARDRLVETDKIEASDKAKAAWDQA